MVVVVHQTLRVAQPVELLDYLGEDIQKGVPVGIIIEDVFAPVSARGNVVQRAWKHDPDGA